MKRREPGSAGSMKLAEGLVSESTRRFHVASAASIHPARSPTRGSGDGGAPLPFPLPADCMVDVCAVAQAASARAHRRNGTRDFITGDLRGK